jgi:hypothetical protein
LGVFVFYPYSVIRELFIDVGTQRAA